jgi:hypothetical protein
MKCHPDRSVAKWRDLLFTIHGIESEWERHPPFVIPTEAEGSAVQGISLGDVFRPTNRSVIPAGA